MRTSIKPLAVVCGLHRSGTTVVGEILRQAGAYVVQEPLNQHFGVSNVPIAYPYIGEEGGQYAPLIDDIVAYRRPWNKAPDRLSATGFRRKLYRLTGGRSGMRWKFLQLRSRLLYAPRQICWKDPFASLATPYLRHHVGARVLCMVRHPAGIHHSTMKRGWNFDIENLRCQADLIVRHCNDIPDEHWALGQANHAASIALLWKVMMRVNDCDNDSMSNLLIVKHEDLCLSAVDTAQKICQHFDLHFTHRVQRFVMRHSQGNVAEPVTGSARNFRRNAKLLPDIWRGRITPKDEELIERVTGDMVRSFYGKW